MTRTIEQAPCFQLVSLLHRATPIIWESCVVRPTHKVQVFASFRPSFDLAWLVRRSHVRETCTPSSPSHRPSKPHTIELVFDAQPLFRKVCQWVLMCTIYHIQSTVFVYTSNLVYSSVVRILYRNVSTSPAYTLHSTALVCICNFYCGIHLTWN